MVPAPTTAIMADFVVSPSSVDCIFSPLFLSHCYSSRLAGRLAEVLEFATIFA
jgi:hypothetical protein